MINTDRIFLFAIFLIYASGVIMIVATFPGDIRLRRSDSRLDFNSIKDALYTKIRTSTLYKSAREERIDKAIYEDLSYLRNLIIAHKGMVSSDKVITNLSERDGILKKSYIKMLSLLRLGRVREAERVLRTGTATSAGKEFASLLITWEELPPEQLEEIIVSCIRSIKETNLTKRKKREEILSDLIYFPATLNVFLIFINFVYISYFMQQKQMFEMIF